MTGLEEWGLSLAWDRHNKQLNNNTMYTTPKMKETELFIYNTTEGETIEQKIARIVNNKEPIKDGAPLIYTERKEGIRASTNIRTDRFQVAIEATEKIAKSYKARREEKAKSAEPTKKGAEPIQGEPEKPSTDKPNN